jgi:catechol 2,3-dioxygenase-like lactoylglutathione lyase family enzyme
MRPKALDHVAVWADEREALAAFLIEACALHEIERTDSFTLVGGDARRGKLTLFDAEGTRERGVLGRVVLRVPDLTEARLRLESLSVLTGYDSGEVVTLDAPANLPLALVEDGATDVIDLDHVVINVPDPPATARAFAALGLDREGDRVRVADKHLTLRRGDPDGSERPLLNHIAFLVDSADDAENEARERGLEIDRVVDAANTRAVFAWGPDRIKLEYVEHKPGFSLT